MHKKRQNVEEINPSYSDHIGKSLRNPFLKWKNQN